MDCFPTDKVLQKWNVGSFQSESQKHFIYWLWVPNYDSSYIKKYSYISISQNIFGDYTTVCPPFRFWSSLETSYTLHIKKIPQKWEMKWELCLHDLHWHSDSYIDTGVICSSQHVCFVTGKCWHTRVQRGNWIAVAEVGFTSSGLNDFKCRCPD